MALKHIMQTDSDTESSLHKQWHHRILAMNTSH